MPERLLSPTAAPSALTTMPACLAKPPLPRTSTLALGLALAVLHALPASACDLATLAGRWTGSAEQPLGTARCLAHGEHVFDGRGRGYYRGQVNCGPRRQTVAYLVNYLLHADCRGAVSYSSGALAELRVGSDGIVRVSLSQAPGAALMTLERVADVTPADDHFTRDLIDRGGAIEAQGQLAWGRLLATTPRRNP